MKARWAVLSGFIVLWPLLISTDANARCFKWEYNGPCETVCDFIRAGDPFYKHIWNQTNCVPAESEVNKNTCKTNSPNTVMSKVTSCRAGPPGPGSFYVCSVTVCGVIDAALSPRVNRTGLERPKVEQPTPKPKVGPGPGLLEGDQGGFVRAAPSATGTPLRSGAPSGGGSAPAAGGGLR